MKASVPLRAVKIFSLINIVENITTLVQSIKDIVIKRGIERFDAFLSSLYSSTQIPIHIDNFIDGLSTVFTAIKVAKVVSNIFSGFSLAGSVIELAVTGRSWKKLDDFNAKYKDVVRRTLGPNGQKMDYNLKKYKAILSFLKDGTSNSLTLKKRINFKGL